MLKAFWHHPPPLRTGIALLENATRYSGGGDPEDGDLRLAWAKS
jgi:hypothetical protein